jgi:predicted RNA binding protein YcfA (HicA-like mRNA interferase family)
VVADRKTRDVLKDLRAAGFEPVRSDGSHTWWKGPQGLGIAVPDGHRVVSAGVVRKVAAVIAKSKGAKP